MKILPANVETYLVAAEIIRRGGVIAFRTDTFYGLGADPFNRIAVSHVTNIKGRDDGKPILLLLADKSDLDRVIKDRSPLFEQVVSSFWPGPMTIVASATDALPDEITASTGTVGVRLPDDPAARSLVRNCGGVLTATSANLAGHPPSRSAAEVESEFSTGTGIALIIDSGEVSATKPSTVLSVTESEPRLIREGVITQEAIERALGLTLNRF